MPDGLRRFEMRAFSAALGAGVASARLSIARGERSCSGAMSVQDRLGIER
jgi:hypothetical protein